MFKEKVRLGSGIVIKDYSDSTSIDSLRAVSLDGGKQRLTWRWPSDNSFNCALVFEVSSKEQGDIDKLVETARVGGDVIEHVTTRTSFDFHIDVTPVNRTSRFAVYPYKLEGKNIIIARQNADRNLTREMIRKINVEYRIARSPVSNGGRGGIISRTGKLFGKLLTPGNNMQGGDFSGYEKVSVHIDRLDEVRRSEEFIYYDVKFGNGKIFHYCADLKILEENDPIIFYLEKNAEVQLVSGSDQSVNFIEKN